MESDSILTFGITLEQADKISRYFHKDLNTLEGYEICLLLDQIIDELEVED